jgi:hypothetical protein
MCGEAATMMVYVDGPTSPGLPMCTRHGTILSEDRQARFSYLRPSDGPVHTCVWENKRGKK